MNFENYKEQILLQYELARSGPDSDFLETPSPARLKDYCLILLERGLSAADMQVFVNFFGGEREGLHHRILMFDIDRMKPVRNFLCKKSNLTRMEAANLAAVLVNFENRPYARFRDKGGTDLKRFRKEKSSPVLGTIAKTGRPVKGFGIALGLAMIFSIGAFTSSKLMTEPQCMQWMGTHYEQVECDLNFGPADVVIPRDEVKLAGMRRLEPCDTVTYFRDGKPVVWYDKYKNKVQFFTMPGLHPENGRTLKPVTAYIIKKYAAKGKK